MLGGSTKRAQGEHVRRGSWQIGTRISTLREVSGIAYPTCARGDHQGRRRYAGPGWTTTRSISSPNRVVVPSSLKDAWPLNDASIFL